MNILFAASEAVPYAASGGLADVVGSLPKKICAKGHDCRIVIPLYKAIGEEFRKEMTQITTITVDVSWRKQYCGIFTAEKNGIVYYFIEGTVFTDFMTTAKDLFSFPVPFLKCSAILTSSRI